jgi:NAD(P)H-dependent FMN reductase
MQILIVNGSLGGGSGNTARALAQFSRHLSPASVVTCHLSDGVIPTAADFSKADGYLFSSGVYWDSWGSPMQKFFELVTPLEGDPCWFGKPAACLVTMHSVGGKEVLSRMQGVLNTFGLYTPPMSALAYSLANQVALRVGEDAGSHVDDLWSLGDLEIVAKNLATAASAPRLKWKSWPVDRANPQRIWLEDVST